MELLAEVEGTTYAAVNVRSPADFVPPFSGMAFPCLVWDHVGQFADADRSIVVKALLAAGCRYTVCAGLDSETWHDAFDSEYVVEHLEDPADERDSAHVMTTFHEGEGADEVAFFFVKCTNFDAYDFNSFLVLQLDHLRRQSR